jgi:tRNA C32,U32 (ribose-2'-O)-methylase TrmJ
MERFTAMLLEVMRKSGYLKPPTTLSAEEKLRRTIRHLGLSPGDVRLALGMLRQILWKIDPEQAPDALPQKERE